MSIARSEMVCMPRQQLTIPPYTRKRLRKLAVLALATLTAALAGHWGTAAVLQVNPLWADETTTPASLTYGTTAFSSLTAAVAAATDGDCILLGPGRYEEPAEEFPIIVDKTIEIRSAEGGSQTVLRSLSLETILQITADGVAIEGLSIEFNRYGMVVLADGARICGNRVCLGDPEYREASCGIWLAGARQAQVTDNEFINCGLAIAGPPVGDASEGLPVLTGLFEVGEDPAFFTTHNIADNLVNGGPLYYLVDTEGSSVPGDAGQVILANCRDVVLDELDVSWTSIGVEVAYSTGVRIMDVTASNCGLFGVYLCYSDDCAVVNVTCEDDAHGLDLRATQRNVLRGCSVTGCGQGIFVSWDRGTSVVDCVAQENGVGVLIASGQGSRMSSNRIDQNEIGIHVLNEHSLQLDANVISRNTTTGMRLSATDCSLHGDSFLENWVGLIAIDTEGIAMSDVEFRANAACGLYMMDVAEVTLTSSRFTDNPQSHLQTAGTLLNVLIIQNSFTGTEGVIFNDMVDSLDLRLNWWGTTGPDEIAERCRGPVVYVPFLMEAP